MRSRTEMSQFLIIFLPTLTVRVFRERLSIFSCVLLSLLVLRVGCWLVVLGLTAL